MPNWCFTRYTFDFSSDPEKGELMYKALEKIKSDDWRADSPVYQKYKDTVDPEWIKDWYGWVLAFCGFDGVEPTVIEARGTLDDYTFDGKILEVNTCTAWHEMPDPIMLLALAIDPEVAAGIGYFAEEGSECSTNMDEETGLQLYYDGGEDELAELFGTERHLISREEAVELYNKAAEILDLEPAETYEDVNFNEIDDLVWSDAEFVELNCRGAYELKNKIPADAPVREFMDKGPSLV